MQLPGGIVINGELRRDFAFAPLTGEIELLLSGASRQASCHAERISEVLQLTLAHIAGQQVTRHLADELSVGDRQFLMCQLSILILGDRPVWLAPNCQSCHQKFDTSYQPSQLPVKPADERYPKTSVATRFGDVRVQVPAGKHQYVLAVTDNEQSAMTALISQITGLSEAKVNKLSDREKQDIELAAEQMSPEISTTLLARCPYCQHDNKIELSPYAALAVSDQPLMGEIHRIACRYHWSEREILQLPRQRRKQYLSLIEASQGVHSAAIERLSGVMP